MPIRPTKLALLLSLTLMCASLLPQEAAGEGLELGRPIGILDPSGHALDAFDRSLRATREHRRTTRILVYGASHTAGDVYTNVLRKSLAERFGSAGPGFVYPVAPWRGYRQAHVEVSAANAAWTIERPTRRNGAQLSLGLGLYALQTTAAEIASVASSHASRIEVWTLAQQGGGSAAVAVDGIDLRTVRTANTAASRAGGLQVSTFAVPDGAHRLDIRTLGDGPVTVLGTTFERETPGVVVDTLGINGATADFHLQAEDNLYKAQLMRRNPNLVVLAYGTNESGSDESIASYEQKLRRVVSRIRQAVPDSSCLLIGPSDRPLKRGRLYEPRERTGQIIDAQKRVSHDFGCGFFDLVEFQGGPMSMVTWVTHTPAMAQRDHVHFTRLGYERLGHVLTDALLANTR